MYKIILAIRYLIQRRITYFAVLAVAACVWIVIIAMTVMTGLVSDFKQKTHNFVGDCVVSTESLVGVGYYEDFMEILEKADFIEAVSPVIKNYALISPVGSERNYGLEIMGIDPVRHSRATGFSQTLHYHKDNAPNVFKRADDPNLLGFVIGIDRWLERDAKGNYAFGPSPVAASLAVSCFPLTAKGALAKAGAGLVNTKTFFFSDTSHSGLARVDSSMVYLPFEQAQLLCMSGSIKRANAIHIKFKPNIELLIGCEKVRQIWLKFKQDMAGKQQANLLDTVRVQSWKDYSRETIAPMEKEQTVFSVMFVFGGITTVFIVFVVFYMIISHKSKDIGILKSIGVSNSNILVLFSIFAFLIGILGSCLGSIAGWLFVWKINTIENWLFEHFKFQLYDRTIYAIGDIPNQVSFGVLAIIIASAIFACLAGAIIPSWQAARQKPVETLQVNQL